MMGEGGGIMYTFIKDHEFTSLFLDTPWELQAFKQDKVLKAR